MLLVIHNLPARTQYSEVKELLIAKCGLDECILDNLQNEGSGMRVTVGVGEEEDAAILVRKINGLYFRGQQLYVQDKRQKKESEQPYRTPMSQQQQYQMPQPQQGYGYTTSMQSAGRYNFMTHPQQPAQETVQNPYTAYGEHQVQPPMSQFGDSSQQPFAAAQPAERFGCRSPSPARQRPEDENSWDAGRFSRDDIRGSASPDRPGPSWGRQDEPSRQPDNSRGPRTERPSRSRGSDRPLKRGARPPDGARDHRAPPASEAARGGRGGRGGHFGSARGGYAPVGQDTRGGGFASAHGGHVPNAQGSRNEHSGTARGGYGPNGQDFRSGILGNNRDGDAPILQDPRGGWFANTRGGHAPIVQNTRGGGFANTRGGYAPNAQASRNDHFGNTSGGYGPNSQDFRSSILGNNRGGDASNAQDSSSGYFSNTRGNYGLKAEDSRSGNFGNNRGGDASNAQDSSSGYFSNTRGNYGLKAEDSRSGNFGDNRGGDASNVQDSSSGNFGNPRGNYGLKAEDSRSRNFGNTRGGHAPNAQYSRSGSFGNTRGGHAPNAQFSRSGNFSNTRGNYGPKAEASRGGNFGNNRGGPARDYSSRVGMPQKRQWNDQQQLQCESGAEPRPIKLAANPTRPEPTQKPPTQAKATSEQYVLSTKVYKSIIDRASGIMMSRIANNLKVINEIAMRRNPMKKMLRRLITVRMGRLAGGVHLGTPEQICAKYRAEYPLSDDALIYSDIKKALAAGSKQVKAKTTKQLVAPPRLKKIPSYKDGDKKLHTQEKLKHKRDMNSLDTCEVSEEYREAIEEEVGAIGKLFNNGFVKAKNNTEELFFTPKNKEECVNQCKKLLMYHVSRRVTNSGMKLLRIYGKPKLPKRIPLENFLSRYNCVSLKKAAQWQIYTASFDNYDVVDHLAHMTPVLIGDSLVTFRHMYIASKKPRIDQKHAKEMRKKFILNMVEKSNVNLLAKDWELQNEEEKKLKAETKIEDSTAKDADDVIYVGGTKDIDYTVDITGDDEQNVKNEEIKVEEIKENHDFLHGDFEVIDEVRGSDNDDVGNVSNLEDKVKDDEMITDDWRENAEDWTNSGEVNDDNNDDKGGNNDNNCDEYGKGDETDNIREANEAEDGNGGEAVDKGEDEYNEASNDEDMGGFYADDVNIDDINEDDLEDY